MNQNLILYLKTKTELVKHIMANNPELEYPEKKMQIWELCCELGQYQYDPECIFRLCRKIIQDKQIDLKYYSTEREQIYRNFFKRN